MVMMVVVVHGTQLRTKEEKEKKEKKGRFEQTREGRW